MPTACSECRHMVCRDHQPKPSPTHWMTCFCGASPNESTFDAISGKLLDPEEEFKLCIRVNLGECPLFEAKVTVFVA